MIFILWIILWLVLNYIFWWFSFNTILCFLVGIFLIMPILLKIRLSELKDTFKNKKLIFINILINFFILPLLAFVITYFVFWINNYSYIFTFILLALIPGGWLLINWLHHTKANLHIGFLLFSINLFIFSFVFIVYNVWTDYFVNMYDKKHTIHNQINYSTLWNWLFKNNNFSSNYLNIPSKNENKKVGCVISELSKKINLKVSWCNLNNNFTMIYGFYWFLVLIIIPFILSRLILIILKKNVKKIIKYVNYISKISAFIIITYIFSLSYIRDIIYLPQIIIIKTIISILLFYIFSALLIKIILKFWNFEKDIEKSLFWNWFTRFITLTLVISLLYAISWKSPGIIIIPVIAYFVQIVFASLLSMYYDKWKF